jgi:flagellar hook-associated protein 2
MSMSVGGMVSGLDTTTLISQLVQAEGAPQAALKTRLSVTNAAAAAYRAVNTRVDAVRTAAETLVKPDTWTVTKASSTATSVNATATSSAATGSLTFTVEKLATAHTVLNQNTGTWSSATSAYGASSIQVFDKLGAAKGAAISVGDADGDGVRTVADAAAAINASSAGLSATVVTISPTEVALQVTSKTTGADAAFSFTGAGAYSINTQGQNAEVKVGTTNPYTVTSATNTFTGLMAGVTLSVSAVEKPTPVTVTIAPDPDAIADKVKALVDAANSALSGIKTNTNPAGGAGSTLKGDSALRTLSGRILNGASTAVGTDGSPSVAGVELNRDGTIKFDKSKFLAALAADPAKVKTLLVGAPKGAGPDGISETADDNVSGVGHRLLDLAKTATDATTGTLTLLAKGRDDLAADIQSKISAWDIRLAKRKDMLTRQFTAMETALSTLQNQSSWLSGQISSLPSAR